MDLVVSRAELSQGIVQQMLCQRLIPIVRAWQVLRCESRWNALSTRSPIMWLNFEKQQNYHAVPSVEHQVANNACGDSSPCHDPRDRRRAWILKFGPVLGITALLIAAIFLITNLDDRYDPTLCPQRREWRELTATEQQDYISAVQCLLRTNSTLEPSVPMYDEFAWFHSHAGFYTHNSGAFLPWHRYFLHIYEQTLRERCNYKGTLAYWDWTRDYKSLEHSPVFDPNTGFGGNGVGEVWVMDTGRCVVDGPFANLRVLYADRTFHPHCLTRGFRDKHHEGHIDGEPLSPESISEVLREKSYEDFVELLEDRVHDAIPMGIGGDFSIFTAPNDPLFYLHHTQLDRLWALWQERQPDRGLTSASYGGLKTGQSHDLASIEDEMYYRGLAPDVKVKDVLDVRNRLLCYRY